MIALIFLAAGTSSLAAGWAQESAVGIESAVPESQAAEAQDRDRRRELDAIADLLIDGNAAEAKSRAEELLKEPDLPAEVASRAEELRKKADGKLAKPESKIEISVKGKGKESGEAMKDASFKVRVARIGKGFAEGVTGLLRVSEKSLSFVRQGRSREEWSIFWKDLVEAHADGDGLWDSPFPLVFVERGGLRYYVVHVDQKGRHLSGQPILSAISRSWRSKEEPVKVPADAPESGTSASGEGG